MVRVCVFGSAGSMGCGCAWMGSGAVRLGSVVRSENVHSAAAAAGWAMGPACQLLLYRGVASPGSAGGSSVAARRAGGQATHAAARYAAVSSAGQAGKVAGHRGRGSCH